MREVAAWRNTSVSRMTGTVAGVDQVGQELTRPDRRQLVDVADEDHRRPAGDRLEQLIGERHIDHRALVDHQQVAVERRILVALELARLRIDLEQPVDRLGLQAR